MIEHACLLPTGEELREGIVLDTDCPMVLGVLAAMSPRCTVTRVSPLPDDEAEIRRAIHRACAAGCDLVVLIGGSGGGHRHSDTLGKDFTHSGMESMLRDPVTTSLYGKNGHLWCKLVCGFLEDTLLINLPGPYREAKAAMEAFRAAVEAAGLDPAAINSAMAEAVRAQYGQPKG